ncbi:MAG: serine hydrolase domain-containing protein [Wenzhouxiangella sp.]|jgi:CubicO group peptidase (beta-lactamase class C family)|nr:serine hydrolase domain-containing protein [Wenzhouxiangella sp.]
MRFSHQLKLLAWTSLLIAPLALGQLTQPPVMEVDPALFDASGADFQTTKEDEASATFPADHVDGLVHSLLREHGLGALTLSIVRDDELVLARGFGLADIDSAGPVIPDQTLFRIGSVSKTFTWTAVMLLVERGRIDLDADLNDYLTQFQIEPAFGQPVTMRDIMHHRGGFEDTLRLFAVADDDPRSLAELLAEHQPRRIHPPGSRTSYSNWASALAALIVENASGQTYEAFIQTELLDPLGMEETTWLPPARMDGDTRARLATGYQLNQGALDIQGYMQIGPYWPAGGIASTATDMARWMRFHLNGGELDGVRLMRPETHARMWTRGFPDRPRGADLAHGFQDRPYREFRTLGHGGATAAYLTNMVLVPELSLGIFLSQNSLHTASAALNLPDLVIDRLIDFEYVPYHFEEHEQAAHALAELAGSYMNNRRVFSTFAAVFSAPNLARVAPASGDSLTLSGGGQTQYFRRLGGDVFSTASGERIVFLRDDRDRVVAIADSMGVHTLEKLGWFANPLTLLTALGLALVLSLTHLLGFWRRLGRGIYTGYAARSAGAAAGLGVVSVLVLIVGLVALIAGLSSFDLATLSETYPHPAMFFVHYSGWGVALAGGLMLLAQWPAWSGSGWGLLKRLHFALFTIVMLLLSMQLWHWRVIGAPVI